MPKTVNATATIEENNELKVEYTLDEVRNKAKINIFLPVATNVDENSADDRFEVVTVNGRNIQIKRGEPVSVNWQTYEALLHSGRYARL